LKRKRKHPRSVIKKEAMHAHHNGILHHKIHQHIARAHVEDRGELEPSPREEIAARPHALGIAGMQALVLEEDLGAM
jgi:hypothetical protein